MQATHRARTKNHFAAIACHPQAVRQIIGDLFPGQAGEPVVKCDTLQQLAKSRRYAIVACAGVSAVLTPPDVVSMLLLLVPLYSLYELALIAIRLTHWRANRKAPVSAEANLSIDDA